MNPLVFVKRCILVLLLNPLIRLSAPYCSWIGCDCDAQKNLTKTTCTNATIMKFVSLPSTNTDKAAIIGAAGGGIVFGSVVTVLVFVCMKK